MSSTIKTLERRVAFLEVDSSEEDSEEEEEEEK